MEDEVTCYLVGRYDNVDVGNEYKTYGFNCITLEGDMVRRVANELQMENGFS